MSFSILSVALLFVCQDAPLQLRRVNRGPEITGSMLMSASLSRNSCLPVEMNFDPNNGRLLAKVDVTQAVILVPEMQAIARLKELQRSSAGAATSKAIGVIIFINVLPKDYRHSDDMFCSLWSNDTVRKLAGLILFLEKTTYGSYRLKGYGTQLVPLLDEPLVETDFSKLQIDKGSTDSPPNVAKGDGIFDADVVDNQLQLVIDKRLTCVIPLHGQTLQF